MKRSLAKIEIDTWLIVTHLYLFHIAGAFMNYGVLKRAQEELLDRIIGTENYIRRLRGKRKEINEERKGLLRRKGLDSKSKRRLKRLEQMQGLNREKEKLLKERLALLRRLGDTIAWYAYGFNRHAIIDLYRSDRKPASLAGRTTLALERKVIDAINNRGDDYFALMHDLTHCLNIGDFTIFSPQGYRVVELKIHRGRRRAIRRDDRRKHQETLLKQIQDYEITGESEELIPGVLMKRHRSRVPDRYEWKLMERLLKRAMLEGHALQSVEGIIVYAAYDINLSEEVIDRVIPLVHEEGQTFIFRSLDQHQYANTAHLLPLFAFDIHPLLILDLVAGNLVLMTIVNIDRLVAKLRESGALVAMIPAEEEREMAISPDFVDRLLLEGLSLDTFVGQCVEVQRLADELRDSK